MVKKSSIVSPAKGTGREAVNGNDGGDEEGDLFVDAEESLQADNVPVATSGSPKSVHGHIQRAAPIADMGNANSIEGVSKEEMNARLRASAKAMQNRGATHTPATGKLVRPSANARGSNPQYRNPLPSATSVQRQLGPTNSIRKSVYDTLEESPVKADSPKAQWTDGTPGISPRKADKRKARRGDGRAVEATVADDGTGQRAATRQSPRMLRSAEANVETNAEPGAEPQAHDGRYRDFFPAHLAPQHPPEEEVGPGADDEIDDEIAPADVPTSVAGGDRDLEANATVIEEDTPRRKRGRPPKSSKVAESSPKRVGKVQRSKKPSKEAISVLPPVARTTRSRHSDDAPTDPANPPGRSLRNKRTVLVESETNSSPAKAQTQTSKPRPTQKKGKKGSSLDKLNRRRSQADGDDQLEEDVAEGKGVVQERSNGEGLFVGGSAQQTQTIPVARVQLSEMNLSRNESNKDEPSSPAILNGTRKRKAGSQVAGDQTSEKRTRFDEATPASGSEDEDEAGESNRTRLFGQWRTFKDLLKKADDIGRTVKKGSREKRSDVELRDPDVEAAVDLCTTAIQLYTALRTHTGPIESEHDPVGTLDEISERVDGLRGENEDYPTTWNDKTKATDIYFHLIRRLVDLSEAAILCYETIDAGKTLEGQMTMGHLNTVALLFQVILELSKAAEKYARPPTKLHVVQPVREMRPIITRIRQAFAEQVYNRDRDEHAARRREQDRLDRMLRNEEDQRRKEREAGARVLRQKWQKLHTERQLAEGGLMPATKRTHLQLPEHYHIEYDQNGIPFEREEIFHPRVGPLPAFIEAASTLQWSLVQLSTLYDGLKEYTGPNVFERIFRRYCVPRGELNKYNVTEIVVEAALLKEKLIDDQEKAYGDVEQWILDIPVWTRPRHIDGQENEDEGIVAMSGALSA